MKRYTDKQRLDWLARNETGLYKTACGGWDMYENGYHRGGIRRAVDSAMRREGRNK